MHRLATTSLVFTLLVVLWGAFVRATGSGAGCGSNWPTCNGAIVPRAPSTQTLIEYIHRLTSGLVLALVFVQWLLARRRLARGSLVRWAALASLVFMLTEALIGGGLVLFEMVAGNTKTVRAVWMIAHLLNTFALLAALALTWWWSGPGAWPATRPPAHLSHSSARPPHVRLVLAGTIALLLVAATGAVAALGDTLFPARSLADGLAQDFAPSAHIFVRLRALHPVLAAGVGFFLLVVLALLTSKLLTLRAHPPWSRRLASAAAAILVAQLLAGLVNLLLLAPIWLQLVHLLLADVLWICLVLVNASLRQESTWVHDHASATNEVDLAPNMASTRSHRDLSPGDHTDERPRLKSAVPAAE